MNIEATLAKIQEEYSLREIWKDGIWLQNQILSGRIHKNQVHYIDVQSRLMEEIYPNEWSFNLQVNIKDFSEVKFIAGRRKRQVVFEFKFYPVIHFENLTIENTIGHSLLIKSIYVKLNTTFSKSNNPLYNYKYNINTMYGIRDMITYNEYQNSYLHSHLTSFTYSKYKLNFNNSFCLGTGEINMMFTKLSQEFQEGFFKTLLFHIKGYLEWESLEGVPYQRIENLFLANKNEGLTYLKLTEINDTGRLILNSRLTTKLDLKWKVENNHLVLVDNEQLEDYCLPFKMKSTYITTHICYKDDKGNYFPINATVESVVIPDNSYIIFKGEKKYLQVDGLLDTSNKKFYIHPQIKQYVKSRLEYEANRNYIRYSVINQLQDKSNNAIAVHV